MTITALIKELERLKKKHSGRLHVCVDARFFARFADDYSHYDVSAVSTDSIRLEKEDSYYRADGTERWGTVVVLS